MATDENKQVVKDLFAAFGSGDIAVLRDLVVEDVIWRLPGKVPHYSGTYKGPDRFADFFQGLFANVGVEAFQPREFVAEADRVLVIGRSRGRVKTQVAHSRTAGSWPSLFATRGLRTSKSTQTPKLLPPRTTYATTLPAKRVIREHGSE